MAYKSGLVHHADESLRAHINNDGPLVPQKLADVTDIATASVLYNSYQDISRIGVERPGNQGSTGYRPNIVKLDRPFKLFIYTERSFATTHYLDKFQKQFDLEVSLARQEIARYNAEVARLDKKFEDDKTRLRSLKTKLVTKEEAVASFQKIGTDLNKSHQLQIAGVLDKVESAAKEVNACESDEVVKMVGEVVGIFRANNIETLAKTLLDGFTTAFGKSWAKIDQLRQLCNAFKTSDMEAIMDIQGMGLFSNQPPQSPKISKGAVSMKKLDSGRIETAMV